MIPDTPLRPFTGASWYSEGESNPAGLCHQVNQRLVCNTPVWGALGKQGGGALLLERISKPDFALTL